MRPFDIGDDPGSVAGSAFAMALGRAFNKGHLSEGAIQDFFEDLEQALAALEHGEPLTEELPNFVGNIVEMFSYGVEAGEKQASGWSAAAADDRAEGPAPHW